MVTAAGRFLAACCIYTAVHIIHITSYVRDRIYLLLLAGANEATEERER